MLFINIKLILIKWIIFYYNAKNANVLNFAPYMNGPKMSRYSLVDDGMRSQWVERVTWGSQDSEMSFGADDDDDLIHRR